MNVTHFEVYAYDPHRGWVLHARFPGQEREEALAEAKEVEKMGMKARVSREVYNTEENTYDEADIYVGRTPEKPHPAAGGIRPVGGGAPSKPHSHTPPPLSLRSMPKKGGKRPDKSGLTVITSRAFSLIVMIVLLGVLGGLGAVRILPDLINLAWGLGLRFDLGADNYESLLISTFGTAFVLVAGPLILLLLPKMFGKKKTKEAEQDSQHRQLQEGRRQKMQESLDVLSRQALMEEAAEIVLPSMDDEPPPPPPAAEETPAAEPPPSMAVVEEDDNASLAATEAGVKLRTFVDSAVNAIKNTKTHLDNYNKFALHLYIAGAVEVLGDNRQLLASERRQLTAHALSTLGTKAEMAHQFYDKVGDYMAEERYHKMVEYGHTAMDDFLKGDEAAAHSQLTGAIQEWSRGATGQAATPTVTVMFTDMVGSTDMTQDRGDVAAQEIVRRHNTIVRMAISQYGGKEIKHTGDGIMASFDDCTGAVDASISIQRNVSNHNKARPDQPLSLRIGLNSGKPIQEENDIFGATVQLAARVCAATKPEQTLCTESVVKRCRGRTEFITPMGAHDLKGFKDPVPLYQIRW